MMAGRIHAMYGPCGIDGVYHVVNVVWHVVASVCHAMNIMNLCVDLNLRVVVECNDK